MALNFSASKVHWLVVIVLFSGSSGLGLMPDQGDNFVNLVSWARHSHSASLHPGVEMGTSEINAGGNPAMYQQPIQLLHATETGISSGLMGLT